MLTTIRTEPHELDLADPNVVERERRTRGVVTSQSHQASILVMTAQVPIALWENSARGTLYPRYWQQTC